MATSLPDDAGPVFERYTVVSEFSETEGLRASDLEEGDTASVTFDNSYDKRFSDEQTFIGEVKHHDPHERDSKVVVLTLVDPDTGRLLHVDTFGAVGVAQAGEQQFTSVGKLLGSDLSCQ